MRERIVEALVKKFLQTYPAKQESMFRESLKYIVNDGSLIAFAQEIGVDTDSLFGVAS